MYNDLFNDTYFKDSQEYIIKRNNSLEGVIMKNEEEITNTTWHKLPYIWSVCLCFLLIIYLRDRLTALLKLYPNNKISDFVWQYIQNNNHEIGIIMLLIGLVMLISIYSIFRLVKGFKNEEIVGKVINSILIVFNIAVIIITLVTNLIVFKIVFLMIIASLVIVGMFAALGNNSNT